MHFKNVSFISIRVYGLFGNWKQILMKRLYFPKTFIVTKSGLVRVLLLLG